MPSQNSAKQRVIEALNGGRLSEAKSELQQIVERDAADPEAWHMLAAVNGQLGLIDKAEMACRRALDLDPQMVAAHLDLGNILYSKGQFDEACDCYREALRYKPDYAMAWHNLGNILSEMRRIGEAIESYEAALRFNPRALTFYNLGNLLQAEQRFDEAIHNYRQVISLVLILYYRSH